MRTVETSINIPDNFEEAILAQLKPRIEAALAIVEDVPSMVKLHASVMNEDVDGKQMPMKKPRPPKHPTNHPRAPLVDTGNMFDNGRWKTEHPDDNTANSVYTPPAYFVYVGEQGRPWLTYDKMNPTVREEIRQLMLAAARGAQ